MSYKSLIIRAVLLFAFIGFPVFFFQKLLSQQTRPVQNPTSGLELQRCFDENNIPCVETLLKAGISPDTCFGGVDSLLVKSIKGKNFPMAELLIKYGATTTKNVAQKNGTPPLQAAIYSGHNALVAMLIGKGADVNYSNFFVKPPLILAVELGNVEAVKLLYEAHADPEKLSNEGKSALEIAKEKNNQDMVLLMDRGGHWSRENPAIIKAALANDYAKLNELINQGANLNEQDELGRTPLFICADNNSVDMATLLLEKNVNVNLADREGQTALFAAIPTGNLNFIEKIISAGADVNVQASNIIDSTYKGRDAFELGHADTPLMYAANLDYPDIVQLLIKSGSRLNAKNSKGSTALMFTAFAGNKETTMVLLEAGANINERNSNNDTALSLVRYMKGRRASENEFYEYIEKELMNRGGII